MISNVAVDDDVSYFLTEDAQLMAVDTHTGEIFDTLSFTPHFSEDFNAVNGSVIVTANDGLVGVYFEDSEQLSIFRFNLPNE